MSDKPKYPLERILPHYDQHNDLESPWTLSFETEDKAQCCLAKFNSEEEAWEQLEAVSYISKKSGHPDVVHIISTLEDLEEGDDFGTEYSLSLDYFSVDMLNLQNSTKKKLQEAHQAWKEKRDPGTKYKLITNMRNLVSEFYQAAVEGGKEVPSALETPKASNNNQGKICYLSTFPSSLC